MLRFLASTAMVLAVSIASFEARADHGSYPDFYRASSLAYRLADMAEHLQYDVSRGPHFTDHDRYPGPGGVYYAAGDLHMAASDLYHYLRGYSRFNGNDVAINNADGEANGAELSLEAVNPLDHTDHGDLDYIFDNVSRSYSNLLYATGGYYAYEMRQISDTYNSLRYSLGR